MSLSLRGFLVASATLMAAGTAVGDADAQKAPTEVIIETEVGEPVMLSDKNGTAYLQIAITGHEPPRTKARPPLNLALVIDRSGSMRGERLAKAKEAALMVVDRLSPNDILSIVTYDSVVEVVVPPMEVREAQGIRNKIRSLTDRGSTALYAGVKTGIQQVRRFFSKNRVNRVILLSDGKANIGPSSPQALSSLGLEAGRLGIPVTTIGLGLGYNEDLMTQLALSSDGNHGFAEHSDHLASIFKHELGDILSVVAQDVVIEIEFEPGVRPVRGINRPLSIRGNKANLKMSQIFAKQKKYVLVEVAVPSSRAGSKRNLAKVGVGYRNLINKKKRKVSRNVAVKFSNRSSVVTRSANKKVMVDVTEALASERHKKAIALRDAGKVEAAKRELRGAAREIRAKNKRYRSKKLDKYAAESEAAADAVAKPAWNRNRKAMKKSVQRVDSNSAW